MTLICVKPFGNFTPGDTVEVPAKAVYDETYFAQKPKDGDK